MAVAVDILVRQVVPSAEGGPHLSGDLGVEGVLVAGVPPLASDAGVPHPRIVDPGRALVLAAEGADVGAAAEEAPFLHRIGADLIDEGHLQPPVAEGHGALADQAMAAEVGLAAEG